MNNKQYSIQLRPARVELVLVLPNPRGLNRHPLSLDTRQALLTRKHS